MEYDETRYKHEIPWPDANAVHLAVKALDNEPLTVAARAAKAKLIKEQAQGELQNARNRYYAAEKEVMERFRADAAKSHGFDVLPEKLRKKIHDLAWESGHSSGLSEVWNAYYEFAEITVSAYEFGRQEGAKK